MVAVDTVRLVEVVNIAAVEQANSSCSIVGILRNSRLVVEAGNKIAVLKHNVDYSCFVGLFVAFCNFISNVLESYNSNNFGFDCLMMMSSWFGLVVMMADIFVVVAVVAG
ncbi:hypothetical protein G9A89_002622 [Geosiphon pyriformis]|nr:hypothetical protein G9A89_002622 [Geosiphon pyriformis]